MAALVASVVAFGGCDRPAPVAPSAPEVKLSAPAPEFEDLAPALTVDRELSSILEEAPRRRIQLLVAIPDEANGTLARQAFRLDAEYFYPASAVKLCVAVAALEKLAELRAQRADLALTTPLRISYSSDRPYDTTLQNELESALIISDNDAYNRLFDFVGAEELNGRLRAMGLRTVRIVHRLGESGETPPPAFELRGGRPINVAQRVGVEIGPAERTLVGTAHVDADGRVVDEPFDFGDKNRISLLDLQDVLAAVTRPDLSEIARPGWSDEDRRALMEIAGKLPSTLIRRQATLLDDRHRPLLAATKSELPDHDIRVYGKGGRAYGFTVINSYIVDATSKRSAFVAATIYANDNETINDDHYEYETVADPFVAGVGRFVARTFLK